jgi:trk system potassium uptake protein
MKVIVMGCGRVGEQLCHLLDNAGHDVTIIDSNQENLEHLDTGHHIRKIRGIGFDKEVLIQAGIESADAFAATSPSDNANIIAARIARNIFQVPRVVARLYDPRRAEIYRRLGLVTISMISWGAERINDLLTHSELDPLVTFGRGEVSLVSLEIPPLLDGHRVDQLAIPGEINVVTITRNNEAIIPTSGTEFQSGDIIHVVVLSSAMNRLEALLGM